jgi:PAS domain S-box-containing protein
MANPTHPAANSSFGGSVLGQAEIAARDWSRHPLGPREEWPAQLLDMLASILNSPQPMFLAWGEELFVFFNDAYRKQLGTRTEAAMGRPLAELWTDEWPELAPAVARALGGEGVKFEEWPLRISRNGDFEDTWWSFSYMPITDRHGGIAGIWCITDEVTRHVLGQRAAALERARQQRLLQQMPGFVAILRGPEHIYEYVNDAYGTISGSGDLIGHPVRHAFPEISSQGFYELLDQVYATGQRYVARGIPIRLRADTERYVDLLYEPILDDEQKVSGIFVGGYDVTDAYRSRVALGESEEQLRLVIEGARDHAILTTDPSGVVTSWSAGAEAVFGWSAAEMIGQSCSRLFLAEDLAQGQDALELSTAAIQGHAKDERWHLRKDGGRVFMNGSVYPLRRNAGSPIQGFIKIARDETERRQILEELRSLNETLEARVEERTRELQDSMDFARLALSAVGGVGVWTYEAATDCFFCDASIAKLYDIDPMEGASGISRERFLANVHEDDRAQLRLTMNDGLINPGDLELEYRIVHQDGSVHWVLSRGYTYFEDGKPVRRTGVGVELTRQREIEEQLRQSQKMEAVGQLTGGLSHDFNNLLTGVIGSLELLQRRIAQGRTDDVDRYINAAQGAAKRAAALTHRLLAFSRRQTLDPKPTDVNRLVAGMLELIQRTVGPSIVLETLAAEGLWSTMVDSGQLENALLNLCINARDALPEGGRIAIETGNRRLDERAARERELPPGQYVLLCVSDTGTGMTPEVIAKAFDPFFTTKPIGQGTGLGLSMIYGFARQSGGQVRIASELGKGTTVCLYLPRHLNRPDAADQATEGGPSLNAGQGETVLIVDDEPTVRMLISEVLDELGYTAIEAEDGRAALEMLQTQKRLDLLVTDVGLPGGMNGRQLAEAARLARPHLKVLFITGYAENDVLSHGHLEPGMHVLTKPFTMEALASRIKQLIAEP